MSPIQHAVSCALTIGHYLRHANPEFIDHDGKRAYFRVSRAASQKEIRDMSCMLVGSLTTEQTTTHTHLFIEIG